MKQSFVIAFAAFFVMTILAKDLAGLAWDIWYVANKTYVAKELCVNKAKPEMHCNGKCHLARQLQQLEEGASDKVVTSTTKKAPVPKQSKVREISWIAVMTSIDLKSEDLLPVLQNADGWMESCEATRALAGDVFHPPTI